MRIMVTGGNGFIGHHVVRCLLGEHEVMVADVLRYGPWRFSRPEVKALQLAELDIRREEVVTAAVERFHPEAIIHLAAIHYIPECEAEPELTMTTNVTGTRHVLEVCPASCRLVFASSGAIYTPKDSAHVETDDLGAVDVYGRSKLEGEALVRERVAAGSLRAVTLRLFNAFGPGETTPHPLPEIMHQLQHGRRKLQLGNLTPKRDYIYVGDIATAIARVATEALPEQENPLVLNVGSGKSHSVQDAISALAEVVGEKLVAETDPSRLRKVDRPLLQADVTKLRRLLPALPETAFLDGLRKTWESPAGLHEPGGRRGA